MENISIKTVVHISTVHSRLDPRIFEKECISLSKAGYKVSLITQDGVNKETNGVWSEKLKGLYGSRFKRMSIGSYRIIKQALKKKPDVIHIHDPEILPFAFLWRKKCHFIYDVHEDYTTDISQKKDIPFFLKGFLVIFLKFFESLARRCFTIIIAENYYQERFQKGIKVLNYPKLDWAKEIKVNRENPKSLLYTGNITEDRGGLIHSRISKYIEDDEIIRITMIGRCDYEFYKKISETIKGDVKVVGVGNYVPFKRIVEEYKKKDWIAGLAVFPKTPHYAKKQLTKFYEYMAAGLPIIYSDFPEWKKLLEPLNVGIAVNPDSPEELILAIRKVKTDQKLRMEMVSNGRKAVFQYFDWKKEEQKLLHLYSKVTSNVS